MSAEAEAHVLARLRPPPAWARPELAGLYVQGEEFALARNLAGRQARLRPGQALGLGSYFNSWYEGPYLRHCDTGPLHLALRLRGDFALRLVRRPPGQASGRAPEVLATLEVRGAGPEEPVILPCPPPATEGEAGRLCLDLTCLGGPDGEGLFLGGEVRAHAPPRPVTLAVGICTYRREEPAARLVRRLLEDPDLERLGVLVCVADNGGTLRLEEHPRLTVLPGPNLGGSGGFSRVMREVARAGRATHLMLMDDDVDCDPESVLRAVGFFQYARQGVALAGCMLDARDPTRLFEAGAVLGENTAEGVGSPIGVRVLGHGQDLLDQDALDALPGPRSFDYGGFWLFALPVDFVRRLGLLLPFFLNADDIEFNLRIRAGLGAPVVLLPPVGVWHDPFYEKFTLSGHYLWVRNLMAVHALHGTFPPGRMLRQLASGLFRELCLYRYERMEVVRRAVEDLLRGPRWLADTPALPRSREVGAGALALCGQGTPAPCGDEDLHAAPPRPCPIRAALRLLTLGGHLLPLGAQSATPACVEAGGRGHWRKTLGHTSARARSPRAATCVEHRLRPWLGLRTFALGLLALLRLGLAFRSLAAAWRAEAPRLASPEAWLEREARAGRDS